MEDVLPQGIASTLNEDIAALDNKLVGEIERILKEVKVLRNALPGLTKERLSRLAPRTTNSVGPALKKLIAALEKEKSGYTELRRNETATMASLNRRATELQAAKQAAGSFTRIKRAVVRLRLEDQLKLCISDTDTTGITRKADELSEVITTDLCNQFDVEAKALDVGKKIDIVLEEIQARKGATYHQIVLSSAMHDVPVSRILSEGENRAIALASFLTEVTLATHPSAIVLDDPVSSLDHKRRDKIARRLVDEAALRQVIVFTHDLRFLFDLQSAADHKGLTPTFQTAFSGYEDAGRIREGLPWEGMTAERRIRKLKNDWQQAAALYRASDEAVYTRLAKDIYTELRETWERAVELILLNEVVTRFGKGVQTQRLAKLLDITQQDYDRVDAGMSRCSDFAHDAALEGAISIPPPDEIEQDIGELEAWMEEIKTRRKKQT